MPRVIYVRYLKPKDARAVARLERRMYPRNQRNGRRGIASDLHAAESDDSNLSIGLFDGSRLAGFILCYVRARRESIFEDFEVHYENAGQLGGRSIYIEDTVVLPRYGRSAFLLYTKWARELRRKAPGLPVDAFCEPDLLERWKKIERAFRHLGLAFDRTSKVKDLSHDQEWHWLSWRQVDRYVRKKHARREPGSPLQDVDLPDAYSARLVQTASDWEVLRGEWDRLVDSMVQASCFLTHDFLFTWWRHFGLSRRLAIIVLYHGPKIVAIAPMMIAPKRILGLYRWRLEFIGDESNMESPDCIVDVGHAPARELLWRCILSTNSEWHAAYFREQRVTADPHPAPGLVDGSRYIVAMSEAVESPYVTFEGSWDDYLGARSKSLRKNLARKRRQLDAAGTWRLEIHESGCAGKHCVETYRDIELRSWKGSRKLGVGGKPAHTAFYCELLERLDPRGKMRFRFLILDDEPIAATFGVYQRGHFASLEICHDQAFDSLSPGVVLTGLELEHCFKSSAYEEYDFLIGTLNNKSSWKTDMHQSRNIYVLPRNLIGRANRLLMFWFKPRFKRLLARFDLLDRFYALLSKVQERLR